MRVSDAASCAAAMSLNDEADAIGSLLRGPVTPQLEARIQRARVRWPADLRLLFHQSVALRKLGRTCEAEAHLRQAQAEHPNSPWPGRTRPLCPYPQAAYYKGSGSLEDAASFVCRTTR